MSSQFTFDRMREIEIFGIPALFTAKAIPPEAVYPGMFRYELQTGQGQRPHCLSSGPGGTFIGTVLSPVPISMDGLREIGPEDLILDTGAGYFTPAEFEEKYLSPDCGQQERYGKED